MYFLRDFKKVLIIIGAAVLMGVALHFAAVTDTFEKYFKDFKTARKPIAAEDRVEKIFDVVEAQRVYDICGHKEPLNLGSISNVSIKELRETFPTKEGWNIEEKGNKLILAQKLNILCSKCEGERHLGAFGEYVAVIKGPPGVNGGYLEVTNIKIKELPLQWQEMIKKGELNFPSAEKMLEAMDSLDEYRNY
ncbi:MAG: hypothetical protein GX088_07975 [Clostridia bacterium]|nr:hypothetical protein [Clostridia bacterium]